MLISQQKIAPRILDFFGNKDRKIIRRYIPNKYLYWVGSGREALRQILINLKGKRVGIPAYTCHVVLEAVKRAGKTPVLYDSSVVADISDIKKIIKKIDVLVLCYNFGFLPEIDKIADLCKKNKVILIEDCAQALGAKYKGRLAGSFGDYAFYSFGISKNIGFCGGMIGSKEKINIAGLKKFPKKKLLKTIIEVIVSPIFFNKYFYPFTRKFLRKELVKEQESLSYTLPRFAKKVILNQFRRYSKILKTRKRNAEYCSKELKGIIDFIKPIKNSNPSCLYFTILTKNRRMLINNLLKEKMELGEMKTFQCFDSNCKKAMKTEQEILTFALYRKFKEMKFMTNKINKVCR